MSEFAPDAAWPPKPSARQRCLKLFLGWALARNGAQFRTIACTLISTRESVAGGAMSRQITLERLLKGCADDSFDDGIRIDTTLEPLAGAGAPVKPAVYEGGKYQRDRRWQTPGDAEPTPVIVIDNVPSQANRLEEALRQHRETVGIPEFVLDLSELGNMPAHLPRQISSLQFPHRNADAYLRDALLDGKDFLQTRVGEALFAATPQACGALVEWFPQSLLYGFWQSHLGKKRANTKHARAWVSEIIGWQPASAETTKSMGLKGDPLNLSTDEVVTSNPDDRAKWAVGASKETSKEVDAGKKDKLSEIGHGQVPFMREADLAAAAVSFARVTQRATVSFAQLRRVSLGSGSADADAAVRTLLVALGLHAHQLAFGRGFALRSGGELRPAASAATWLRAGSDEPCDLGDAAATRALVQEAKTHAASLQVALAGWDKAPTVLTPKDNLMAAIRSTWPAEGG